MSKSEGKRRRRVHTPEFKAETVQLVLTGGRSVGQVAGDLDLAESLVRGWVRQAEVDAGEGRRAPSRRRRRKSFRSCGRR